MSLINCLNCKFLQFKIMHKNNFMDYMVNNIQLMKQNLIYVLRV